MRARPYLLGLAAAGAAVIALATTDSQVAAQAELTVRDALGQTTGSSDTRTGRVEDIDKVELLAMLERGNVRLIDVRTDEEVAQGMIPGAEHIQLDQFDPAKLDLTDGREVVLYCRSGRRSNIAGELLAAHTGEPVKSLEGGILAWQAAGEDMAKGE